ncbi:methionine gamma-lyase [Methanosarcina sp. 2.H.T.1A.6]|uniref:trans-sulfuration enzyme family protein n=1 Tax=unclassified Methanosarcina TaxID=2644672 RepID=UPI0006223CA6|nr:MULTISPECIES: PLP-dependent aspartate aminotransferase family protein [unclassified Methanosarcina]KKG13212.1 methionine gamma-lyase [Methanosarcina sp. 2.H.T.1A.15]KKG13409.1 methionine gamma-lyase [Methanosarcina sp. 2.H.T.1A.3]KKG24110.1 methionine gamma-lyase [Methanosarcina sp. 2.H.T.1A.6]KKG26886.1 methionine gamma-lyase [Methanosarcina sp. 2.H.T.1A.8]
MERELKFATKCVHAGEKPDPVFGAHTTPIFQTSTFIFENVEQGAARFSGEKAGYVYARISPNTPTHAVLAEKVAVLESGETGQTFASGMAAITAVVLSALKQGDHLISTDVVYGCTYSLFSEVLPGLGIDVSFVDTSGIENVRAAFKPETKMVFLETPANPTITVCDIREIAGLARAQGAICVVDNTFATPYFQKPLLFGADVSLSSCTKYIGGHADLLGGVVVGSRDFMKSLGKVVGYTGGIMGVHEAWLCIRGLKTLHIRMDRHAENAMKVASFLESHPAVMWVRYPGLSSHPQHEVAKKQMSGYGGMLSFEIRGGVEAGRRLMDSVRLCSLAVSLGATDTLIQHPASMTHACIPGHIRNKVGIKDGLVRLSVGIEDPEDIIADLEQALSKT